MKKFYCSVVAACFFLFAFSQEKYQYKKGSVFSIHFTLHDFETVADIKAIGLSGVLEQDKWAETDHMGPGFALGYTKGLTDHLDFMAHFGASFLTYPVPGKSSTRDGQGTLIETDANLHIKLTSDRYWVSPYLSIGAGISAYKSYYGAYMPLAVGLQGNLFDETFLFLTANYRVAVTSNAEDHLFYSFGIGGNIGKKKDAAASPATAGF